MLTHHKSPHANGQRNSHNSLRHHRHPHHNHPRLTLHPPIRVRLHPPSREALAVDLSGGSGGEWKRHSPPQSLPAETTTERLAYCFFGGPEVQEGFDFIGLVVHPGEFFGIEPAVGEAGDLEGSSLLQVNAERPVGTGRDNHQVVSVADAHGQRIDMRLAEIVVSQYRLGLQKRPRKREQQFVGCRAGITTGRCQPDVRGFQIGARTLNHRKKVSR